MLWTLDDAVTATKGEKQQNNDKTDISTVTHDSHKVKGGALFIALIGPNHDAHKFIDEVFDKGATAAMVSKEWWDNTGKTSFSDKNFIVVEDTQIGLENLATAARLRSRAIVIGITGSVGKTSTKEFLATILSAQGSCHSNERSFNNHWGVPLTLANLPIDVDFAVIEMGINHAGEMMKLTKQVKPDIALVTTIEAAHIGNFSTVAEIAEAKSEIFACMSDAVVKGGVAILNSDNPYTPTLQKRAEKYGIEKIVSFGESQDGEARLKDCTLLSDSSKVIAKFFDSKHKYKLPVPGKHFVINSLSILLIIDILGLDMNKAIKSLQEITPVEGRGNNILVYLNQGSEPITIIDESYNASPVSMNAALKVLEITEPLAEGRRIVVFGDMLELGAEGANLHIALANPVLKAHTDMVFACGPLMEALYNIIPPSWQGGYAENSRDLAEMVKNIIKSGDVVLIKGSLGSKMAYVVQALQDMDCRNNSNTKIEKITKGS